MRSPVFHSTDPLVGALVSTLSPPGDLVLHKSTARQRVIGLQIIVVYTLAREVIPQPTPQPKPSKEIRTCLLIRASEPCRTQTFFSRSSFWLVTRVSPVRLLFPFACLSLMSNGPGPRTSTRLVSSPIGRRETGTGHLRPLAFPFQNSSPGTFPTAMYCNKRRSPKERGAPPRVRY